MMMLAFAACGSAEAQPPAGAIKPPAGWQAMPAAVAAASSAAAADGVIVDGVEVWGDASLGCYALSIQLHGGSANADALGTQIIDGLAAENIGATQEPGEGFTLAIERAPYKGRLRARLGDGRVDAIACVANQRDPAACEVACKTLLGAL